MRNVDVYPRKKIKDLEISRHHRIKAALADYDGKVVLVIEVADAFNELAIRKSISVQWLVDPLDGEEKIAVFAGILGGFMMNAYDQGVANTRAKLQNIVNEFKLLL